MGGGCHVAAADWWITLWEKRTMAARICGGCVKASRWRAGGFVKANSEGGWTAFWAGGYDNFGWR